MLLFFLRSTGNFFLISTTYCLEAVCSLRCSIESSLASFNLLSENRLWHRKKSDVANRTQTLPWLLCCVTLIVTQRQGNKAKVTSQITGPTFSRVKRWWQNSCKHTAMATATWQVQVDPSNFVKICNVCIHLLTKHHVHFTSGHEVVLALLGWMLSLQATAPIENVDSANKELVE